MRVEIVDGDRTRSLRRSVLRPCDPPDSTLPGDGLDQAFHFAALDDDATVLSTCFVFADDWPFADPLDATGPGWHLRQMATDPAHRGRGAGSAVIKAVIAYVAALPANQRTAGQYTVDRPGGVLWCHARVPAIPFYERHRFRAVGDVHPSGAPPIPHRFMYRRPG